MNIRDEQDDAFCRLTPLIEALNPAESVKIAANFEAFREDDTRGVGLSYSARKTAAVEFAWQ